MFRALTNASNRELGKAIGLALLVALSGFAGCSGTGSGPRDDAAFSPEEIHRQRVLAPGQPFWPFQMATRQLDAGQTAPARAYLDTALTLDPNYAPAVSLLSKIQYDTGEYEQAASMLKGFLARNPDAPDAVRVALALHLQALAEPRESAVHLAACDDRSGPVQTALTIAHLQGDDFQNSLPRARQALEKHPGSAANHNNHGIALLYAGRPVAARRAFLHALEIAPELPGPLYNLAIVENFYFFDEQAGRSYFRRYRTAARDRLAIDPDDLGATLGDDAVVAKAGSEVRP
ncbi:MAG: tetratricopeptide repeat protein [bacterium]|nr:tetratricopeptide repeat protein [bacterium]